MSRNPEEKEKCQEKLSRMQKYLPFLNFMIDKIKKKNEASLECQLNKFQVLRSMIAEKNEKYTLDVLMKVEHIIEKLILKLDYKGDAEKSTEVKGIKSTKPKVLPSISRTPFPKSGDFKIPKEDPKSQNLSSSKIDSNMTSPKMSAGMNNNQNKDKDEAQPLEEKNKRDVSEKILGTDLDKDLDGFDLTDCSNVSEGNSKSVLTSDSVGPERAPPQEDLLSSSREKLLKSLQNRLFPNRTEQTSSHKTNHSLNSEGSVKTSDQSSGCDIKSGSSESNEHSVSSSCNIKNRTLEKPNPVCSKSTKSYGLLEKQRNDADCSIINLKQKLKEKLSTDICEVYRVPGKSIGGSLRGLKDSRDHKKSNFSEEGELFKPDVLTRIKVPSRTGSSGLQPSETKDKCRQDFRISELKEKSSVNTSQNFSGSVINKQAYRPSKLNEFNNNKTNTPLEKKSSHKYDVNKLSEKEEKTEKQYEMNKLNDEELTEFVKENIQHLPHLAKLKPAELRKTVESSFSDCGILSDVEIISDDSLQEFDEFLSSTNKSPNELKLTALPPNSKSKNKERHPLASLKIAEVDGDSAPKNIKPGAISSTDISESERAGDKIHDADALSLADSMDEEEDYAIKLIEETTPKIVSVKKKGLLDLPMPETSDLFDDITSIESFECSKSSNEIRDPRLKKFIGPPENESKSNKIDSSCQTNQNSYQFLSFAAEPQEEFLPASFPVDSSSKGSQRNEHRLEERPSTTSLLCEDPSGCSNKYSKELKNSYSNSCTTAHFKNDPRLQIHNPSPKSYAEYKRMKRKEQEKLALSETPPQVITQQFCDNAVSESTYNLSDKNIPRADLSKASKNHWSKHGNSNSKNRYFRFKNSSRSRNRKKSKFSQAKIAQRRDDLQGKKGREDNRQKINNEKRRMEQSEELISPLEKLYQTENKPKTGRGYGIQHFKIPKKVKSLTSESSPQQGPVKEAINVKNDPQIQTVNSSNEPDSVKTVLSKGTTIEPASAEPLEEKTKATQKTTATELKKKTNEENEIVIKAPNEKLSSENKEDINKVITAEVNQKDEDSEKVDSHTVPYSKKDNQPQSEVRSKIDSETKLVNVCKTIQNVKKDVEEQAVGKVEPIISDVEPVKKYEPEIVECDSSVENSTLNATMPGKISDAPGEKSTIMSKEEITQEFVEALIRKSFESGQGKLLLAQAKLFEELGRKLNSKKLKTIQRIINSESDSSSSSSESSSSNEEKKKKKSKKSKKSKKKGKKNRRLVISSTSSMSSSSSSTESEESDEDKNLTKKKKLDSPETKDKVNENSPSEDCQTKKNDLPGKSKSKNKKKRSDYPGCFSRRRNKRKQHQNKLIEKILNESPVNPEETPAKEQEPKTKPKPKTKIKTELDKLHEDIKNMFISSGVVTATGQRMCRILRNSGGKMDNLDIVKESAKMVEEEKLKKVQTYSRNARPRNTTRQDSRSRSQSLDKSADRLSSTNHTESGCDRDPKLKSVPYVLLQKVDLNNFGYGVKISDDCISFSRIQGRNTAIRGFKTSCKSFDSEKTSKSPTKSIPKGIFLARNRRKYERLNGKVCKTSFMRKKLMDVVKNLPLKMAKIKHLQFSEKKNEETRKKKMVPEKLDRKMARLEETKQFSDDDLVDHAFQLRKISYRCKVCSRNFKNITEHYKTVHPEHGVLISRLCQKEAIKAKSDAVKNNYEEQSALKELLKKNTKTAIKGSSSYQCRMCSTSRTNDVNVFFTHVTTHTGEVRFQCPQEDCDVATANGEEIKFHILTKHPKSRYELYNKIIELYPSPIEGCQLFGFLCSKCNFVQLSRSNIEAHVSKQHPSDNIKIFKINMASDTLGRSKIKRMVMKSTAKNSEQFSRSLPDKKKNEELAEPGTIIINDESEVGIEVDKLQQPKSRSEADESNGENEVTSTIKTAPEKGETKVAETDKSGQVNVTEDIVSSGNIIEEEALVMNDAPETEENAERDSVGTKDRIIESLEVGPLKSLLLENSEVYYKCGIPNCGIFIKGFEKFAQHITYYHHRRKWDGICHICSLRVATDLLSGLKHLKFHLLKNKSVELKREFLSPKGVINSEESVRSKEGFSGCQDVKSVEHVGVPYPNKPLLKVRSLQGDRLSTPKESVDGNGLNILTEEETVQTSQTNKMFTIENVRSLISEVEPDASDINQEQVYVAKDHHPSGSKVGPGKVILVRSCPTRKIAILPEKKSVSLDVGQFNLVQPPGPAHPVVLSQLSTCSPIHLLSSLQTSGQNPRIALKPVIVTNSATFKGNSTMVPVIRPAIASPSIPPASAASETSESVQKSAPNETPDSNRLIKSKHPIEITVSVSPTDPNSPTVAARVKTLSEVSNSEEQEDKGLINPLKIFTSIGSKIVKDAAIYKQMLTKTKLCHLFKCMAVECSFTCNSENIFTRHIGLHEAQRRLRKNKDLKGGFCLLKKNYKTFQWQQCAYCCQVHNYIDGALSQHIVSEHGHCTYQCAYCFYRAISQNYVEIHQNLVHSQALKTSSRTIYKCQPLASSTSRPMILEKRPKKQSVRPYICDQCGKNFFVTQEFLNHLTTEHQAVTAYTCHICKNLCFKANRLINHYKLHSYCTYQCAYCLHGTETEVEMVFHLCNFHFSQPAVMYLRALPEGVESQGISQLESLKVVVYESESLNEDCIIEADVETEEDPAYDPLKESIDLSEIVAELGINSDDQAECEVTPLLKELASLSDQNAKDVTVKTLLPNAQFSSENDNISEGCSVLISSGVSLASTQNDDKEMSIPLGQLPLEALSIKHVQHSSATKNVEPPKRSPNLKEPGNGFPGKEICQSSVNKEEEKASGPSLTPYVHNLPKVLVTRIVGPKNVYPARRLAATKKTEDSSQAKAKVLVENVSSSYEILSREDGKSVHRPKNKPDEVPKNQNLEDSKKDSIEKDSVSIENTSPLITGVVSLSKSGFDNDSNESISSVRDNNVSISKIVINISDGKPSIPLKPPVSNDNNFQTDDSSTFLNTNPELIIDEKQTGKDNADEAYQDPKSPDIIILKEGRPDKNIETVTLDSDDEKDFESSKYQNEENSKKAKKLSDAKGEIRKEMEMLRHRMANETDSLLFDNSKENDSRLDLTVTLPETRSASQPKDILSPLEEAICSLNKKLQSETAKAREEEAKIDGKVGENNSEFTESIKTRTRFGSRDRKRECAEEKNGEEEVNKKEESNKNKKVQKELVGKELYICGNEQCTFAAENISSLKDHLYVCDFSRLSSVLVCPHCSKHFKQFSPYLEHLKYHGEKKFHCGLCSFSSAVESATVKHLKQKHRCHVTKSIPKEPPKEQHIVFYPKNYKIDKIDFEENGYSPGDENKLPLQSIYQVNVKCAMCPYFTKVRSNMVRHLKIHVKSTETEGVIVPSTAPTNPVPCLETKEKMFDKMTNLAASSQLAQAEKEKLTALPPQIEAKFPQFVAEHLRFKCCLPDCNYITVDDRMLKHHIKALHNEINRYSCPHCRSTVHIDMRNVPLEKVGHHLKFHDSRLYKCGHCIYIHYQKNLVEKHSCEKHPDRRYFVQTVRDSGVTSEEEHSGSEGDAVVWKCARCEDFQSLFKSKLKDHLLNEHKTKANFQCQLCSMTGNGFKNFASHFASKHPGEKVAFTPLFYEQKVPSSKLGSLSGSSSGADSSSEHFDTTPLWQRGAPRIRHIRGILIEEEEVKTKKTKRWSVEEAETTEPVAPKNSAFYCPLCSDKKKVFFTKSEDYFRTHLYQELNYQQFACILCGKMFVNKKDFDKHHARMHPDKPPEMNQTKEDGEIIFWVDKVIAKQREQMNEKKRKLSDAESSESSSPSKKKKES